MIKPIRQSENTTPPAYQWLGRMEYTSFLQQMQAYVKNFDTNPVVWFCEHEHVYTTGKRGINNSLSSLKAPLIMTERGGETTYHGVGQLMMYPILDLKAYRLNVRDYIHLLEQSCIDLLAAYDIQAKRDCGLPGVWINDKKIAALGIRVSHGIASHGIALNISTDLSWFDSINPCGTSRLATSMQQQGTLPLDLETIAEQWFEIWNT